MSKHFRKIRYAKLKTQPQRTQRERSMTISRRNILKVGAGVVVAGGFTFRAAYAEMAKLAKKDSYKVGFAQTESNNPWRLAQTASMKDEAAKRGWQLVYTDAAGSAAKQVADVRSMIAQKVDVILLAPREEKPLIPAVMEAKKAGIPMILVDRNVDQTLAKAGEDYAAFIGSDFVKEGNMVAEVMVKALGGKAKIIELQGTVGSSPANDRASGFKDYIKDHPGMEVIASQSGDFARDKGRQVFETLYQAHPEATALYSHNDEMTMGAIAAMEAAGKVPGKDLIIGTIDGTKDAAQAIADGKVLVCVECNPKFGPAAFAAIEKMGNGETLPVKLVNTDRVFTKDNVAAYMPEAY
jgi:galactofuranose transport system substrate-binding protein